MATEAKHTPGDWQIADLNLRGMFTNDGEISIMGGTGLDRKPVASVRCQSSFKRGEGSAAKCTERDANARLIAAAPDMLAELKWLRVNYAAGPTKEINTRIDAVIAAAEPR